VSATKLRKGVNYLCGFCQTGQCRSCPGAVNRGPGKGLLTCSCPNPGHDHRPRCLACGNRNPDEVTIGWRCQEPLICQGRIVERALTNPLYAELLAAKGAPLGGTARRQALAARLAAEVTAEVERAGIDREPAARGQCQCEGAHVKCRETPQPTKSRFAVGHDQALKMSLRKRARQTHDLGVAEDAKRRLAELGWPE